MMPEGRLLMVALLGLIAGNVGAQTELPPVQAAITDLAQRLGVPVEQIRVVAVEPVTWPDTSLGNPRPGEIYAQVPTEGYRVMLQQATTRYEYHTDHATRVVLVGSSTTGLVEGPTVEGASFSVWNGSVDLSGDFGAFNMPPGSRFGPGGPGTALPLPYGTGAFNPFWAGWASGVTTGATPGTDAGRQFREDNFSALVANRSFLTGRYGGCVEVVVRAQGVQGGAVGPAPWGGIGALMLGAAARGPAEPGREWLGRKFFAVGPKIDLIALAYDGGSVGGGWLRASGIYESFYGEIGLETLGRLDGDGWGTRVSELFVADRIGGTDLIAGRQRYLEGPVTNSGLGALFGVTHFDGVCVQHRRNRFTGTLAWLDEYQGWGEADGRRGWFARLSAPAAGGAFGMNLLYEAEEDDWGLSLDGSVPALPGTLDLYAEVGEDPRGRSLGTVGLYFPGLYRAADIDLFVEYADREGFEGTLSAAAYRQAGGGWTGVAGMRFPQHDDAEFALGVAWRLGSPSS